MATATSKILALILFLSAPLFSDWQLSYVLASSKQFSSLRLRYKDPSPYQWTHTDLIISPSGVRLIISLLLCPLESADNITLSAQSSDVKKDLKGKVLMGGEKILLTEEDASWMIEQQLNGCDINLKFDKYQTTLKPDNFRESWAQIKHLLVTNKIALQVKS